MSIEIVLVPLAMAAFAAWKARSIEDGNICLVETRLKDPVLLSRALRATGATEVREDGATVRAVWPELSATFTRNEEGVLTAHVDATDSAQAVALVSSIDAAYGLEVQREVVDRVHRRASELGMNLVSQMDGQNGEVTILLEEVRA